MNRRAVFLCWRGCVLGAVFAVGVVGCAVAPTASPSPGSGQATWRAVTPPGTKHYELTMGQVATGSVLRSEVAPVYPPAMLLSCPPRMEIRALVIVNTEGHVSDVRDDDTVPAVPARRPFVAAVQQAVRQWDFSPLVISNLAANGGGTMHKVDSQAEAFSLSYVFDFSCHGGTGSTMIHKAGASAS